jgi:hypothetical protein
MDIENFRKEINEVEGNVDTTITLQHPTNAGRSELIDLTGTADFFFPSLAI